MEKKIKEVFKNWGFDVIEIKDLEKMYPEYKVFKGKYNITIDKTNIIIGTTLKFIEEELNGSIGINWSEDGLKLLLRTM